MNTLLDPHRPPSCTGLQAYDDCPFNYFQERVGGVLTYSDVALRGSVFHTAAKLYTRLLANARLTDDADLAHQALDQALIIEACPLRLVTEVAMLWARHVERFRLNLDAYVANEEKAPDPDYIWISDLTYCHVEADEVENHDYKTYHVGLTETQAREDFQAKFTSWRASVIYPGFARYRFTFVFVRLGIQVSVAWTAQELAEFGEHVARLDAARRAAIQRWLAEGQTDGVAWPGLRYVFPPRPGARCQYCKVECPRIEDARRAIERVETRDDAERVAADILALEGALKARKAALKGYCEVEGPVEVNKMEFANRPRVETSYPAIAVIAHLLDERLKPELTYAADEVAGMVLDAVPNLTWSRTALAKVLKKYPGLGQAGDEKTTWVFGPKKVDVTELAASAD